jgi:hypothetical protein
MSDMNSLLQPLSVSLTAAVLLGCLSSVRADSLPLRVLAKGAFSGIQEPSQQVIKDKSALEMAWAKHSSGGRGTGKLPEVDFTKEMVILVAMGRKNTGGYAIQVTKVEPVGDKLQISVQRTSPKPGSMAIQALTSPFQVVAVPKSDLTPEFVDASPRPGKDVSGG